MQLEKLLEVNVSELLPGDVLAKDVQNINGTILTKANTKLNDTLITALKKYYIPSVFVYRKVTVDSRDISINLQNLVFEEAKSLIIQAIPKLIKKNKNQEELKNIVLDTINTKNVLSLMTRLRSIGEYIFKHSIDVAVLSVAIAREMDFPVHRLSIMCTAALLHDIGMTRVPREIINKTDELSESERQFIQMHPKLGYKIIEETNEFNLEICKIVLQHHERFDGTGYPNRLENDNIHVMAKIIAVCDVYSALINDRPYRPKFKKSESIEFLLGTGNYYFNNDIVNALVKCILVYPYGQWIELNTREIGIVIEDENEKFSIRPKVMIYFDENGNELTEPKEIDLSLRDNINISIIRNV